MAVEDGLRTMHDGRAGTWGNGMLRYLAPGLSPTLDDLAWLMIVLSDNIATRALIRELGGPEVIHTEMDALGVPHLRLQSSLLDEYRFPATPHDLAEVELR